MRHLVFALLVTACTPAAPPGDPDVETDADTDADSDADSDADADTDSDTEVDTDTGSGCAADLDGDGADACADCDDADPAVFPGAPERCNGVDDDCDGLLHPDEDDEDLDGAPDCTVCAVEGYWSPSPLTGVSLQSQLGVLTDGHSCTSYDDERLFMFSTLDAGTGSITCVYTGVSIPATGDIPDGSLMNTEHSWPQSMGADTNPARCDLHHLYPVEPSANSRRNNHPYGVPVTVTWSEGGSVYGDDANGVRVFEPRDEHKGNAARSMLWFATRYGYPLSEDELLLYQTWNSLDPVDAAERERSVAIGLRQGRANPWVVCEGYVDRL